MKSGLRWAAVIAFGLAPLVWIDDAGMSRAVALACFVIAAWLLEVVPPFVPTFLLVAAAPLIITGVDLRTTLSWGADPLLALFLGGFALGTSAASTGLDQRMAEIMVRASRGSSRGLVLTTAAGGFLTSMWMSNAAAASVQLAALQPLLRTPSALRSALLLAIAMGTNFGGMVTPIGSGPNAIAVAATSISFVQWMGLGLPLAGLLIAIATALILWRFRVGGPIDLAPTERVPLDARQIGLVVVFGCAVVAWLSEPLHGISAASVSLLVAVVLFATGLLRPKDLGSIDWATLLLIAGGLVTGRLLEHSGAMAALASSVPLSTMSFELRAVIAVGMAALLSALMSNTATALLLIPLVSALEPSPSLPILIAMGCGLGVPFSISTPPNAMVVGAGVSSRDLLKIGLPLMIGGVLLVALTGPWILRWFGV